MRLICLPLVVSVSSLAVCAVAGTPLVSPDFVAAKRLSSTPPAVTVRSLDTPAVPAGLIVSMPVPLPATSAGAVAKPLDRITAANKAALQEPRGEGFISAIQVYPYMEGALYRLYAAPDRVSDITLQAGEGLIAISSGDTARWIIGNTKSGAGADARVHILVKPQLSGLKTNLIIATDRRTYHLQMESTPATAMAALSWRYPQDGLLALKAAEKRAQVAAPTADAIALENVHFGYAITGAKPAWRPVRAFDDGARVFIEFPNDLSTTEAPPLFVVGKGGQAQLVNYRVSRNYYIVEGLFEVAELRLGEKPQAIVRITADRKGGARHD
ncbi:hypothetical protein MMA231_03673 (plasmid) [Asticcacaulis sp. MM231]|uniref:P-type conjugative transfer protein TrbG n=1 Tax=Asticcacaulis sp. MM231 TaxID=3157666 RepID=UPI0032D59BB3